MLKFCPSVGLWIRPGSLALSEAGALTCDAADFDGTDVMTRGANMTGAVDSKLGLLSFWMRLDGGNGNLQYPLIGIKQPFDQATLIASRDNQNKIVIQDGQYLSYYLQSTSTYTSGATWRHILASWDSGAGNKHLYINDTDDLDGAASSTSNFACPYSTGTDWAVGDVFSSPLDGCLAEVWFTPGQYLDLSIASNRRKFITSGGKPANLGSDGSAPLGVVPLIYLHLDDAEAVANFAVNRGGGGNFSITGTLATASSSPSD